MRIGHANREAHRFQDGYVFASVGHVGNSIGRRGVLLSQLFEGMGQELFNAAILSVAVMMLAWHNIWMTSHGRELAANARRIGADVRSGASELSIVLIVIGVAVLR